MRLRHALASIAVVAIVASACSDIPEEAVRTGELAATPTPLPTATPVDEGADEVATEAPATEAPTPEPTPTQEPAAEPTPTAAPATVGERGPYPVGVITFSLGDRDVEVWYPADAAAIEGQATEIFDTLSAIPEEYQALLPPELTGTYDTGAYRDAAPTAEGGPFPVVIYSHGFGAFRQVATNYTTFLASYGMVVASADHLERGIAEQVRDILQAGQYDATNTAPDADVATVAATIEVLGEAGPVAAIADLERVAITGHSAGAGTSVRAAIALDQLDGFVSISGGPALTVDGDIGTRFASIEGATVGTWTLDVTAVDETSVTIAVNGGEAQAIPFDDPVVDLGDGATATLGVNAEVPPTVGTATFTLATTDKPALVLIAENDAVVTPDRSEALFAGLEGPKTLINIANAGHNSFTDSCVGIRDLGGLGSLVAILGEAQVARAEDGCTPDSVDPLLTQAVTGYSTVSFLADLFELPSEQPLDEATLAAITPLAAFAQS
jgi:predicted dienelactone hydrolase